jgi:hypothetical protein
VQASDAQPHSDPNPGDGVDGALPGIVQSTFDDRWDGIIRADCHTDHSDNDEAQSDDEALSDDSESDSYVDWDVIGSESGLSPWDKLGESYDRDAAAIGIFDCL